MFAFEDIGLNKSFATTNTELFACKMILMVDYIVCRGWIASAGNLIATKWEWKITRLFCCCFWEFKETVKVKYQISLTNESCQLVLGP